MNHDLLNYPEQTLQRIFEQLPSPHGRGDRGEGIFSGALNRKGNALMIDARNIYRKVTRKIFDFSPEQLQNILSIVWLYRGETKRFHDLVVGYISKSLEEAVKSIPLAADYEAVFDKLNKRVAPFIATLSKDSKSAETIKELAACIKAYKDNCTVFSKLADEKLAWWEKQNKDDVKLFDAVKELDIFAAENNKLIKEAELMFRLINRLIDECLNTHNAKESEEWKAKEITNLKKQTEEARDIAVNQLKIVRYFYHQAEWLTERFPEETLRDVDGLVKLVDKKELEENDWSLTPGRYVGVAPEEEDPDFDFGEAMQAIHEELEDLNAEAVRLAATIKKNFEELGV